MKRWILLLFTLTRVALTIAQNAPFTILSNNADTANKKLYVEIMYEQPSCHDYQARFRMETKKLGSLGLVKVDSFLNNEGTFINVGDSILQRPKAGGYMLLFDLPKVDSEDSVYICVETQMLPYLCEGCAATGSNVLFSKNDIKQNCPYKGNDLIACYQKRQVWEAWIQDSRDCKTYRIVQMPDSRWWFAQNLNYQKDLNYRTLQSGAKSIVGDRSEYWCPSGNSAEGDSSVPASALHHNSSTNNLSINVASCNTYGALYSWTTAMSLNGRTETTLASTPTPLGEPSISQGICPDGWLIPSDNDWGMMLNAVEVGNSQGILNHTYGDSTIGAFGSQYGISTLKTSHSCLAHSSAVDTFCAKYTNPSWAWHRASYDGKINAPYALGIDKYGFGIRPSGVREYNGSSYHDLGVGASFWSSTQYNNDRGFYRYFPYNSTIGRYHNGKGEAQSIRCISSAISIISPTSISYNVTSISIKASSLISNTTYTWTVNSIDIPNISNIVSFRDNNTTSAHSTTADINGITSADDGKTFFLQLKTSGPKGIDSALILIKIGCQNRLKAKINIEPYSINGALTAVAVATGGSGNYSYAWGNGSNSYTSDNTSKQNIETLAGTLAQNRTWYLKIQDNEDGCISSQVEMSYTHPAIPDGTSFCPECGFNKGVWVDAWLSNSVNTASAVGPNCWGNDANCGLFPNASTSAMYRGSDDGWANTNAFNSLGTSCVYTTSPTRTCATSNLYLPGAGELKKAATTGLLSGTRLSSTIKGGDCDDLIAISTAGNDVADDEGKANSSQCMWRVNKAPISEVIAEIEINGNSSNGKIMVTASVTGGNGPYAYAWGNGNNTYETSNTNEQNITTAAGTAAQVKTWYLKVKDSDGNTSVQVSKSYTFPAIPSNTTFCANCGVDNAINFDTWITTPAWIKGANSSVTNMIEYCSSKGARYSLPSRAEVINMCANTTVKELYTVDKMGAAPSNDATFVQYSTDIINSGYSINNGPNGTYGACVVTSSATNAEWYRSTGCTWHP